MTTTIAFFSYLAESNERERFKDIWECVESIQREEGWILIGTPTIS